MQFDYAVHLVKRCVFIFSKTAMTLSFVRTYGLRQLTTTNSDKKYWWILDLSGKYSYAYLCILSTDMCGRTVCEWGPLWSSHKVDVTSVTLWSHYSLHSNKHPLAKLLHPSSRHYSAVCWLAAKYKLSTCQVQWKFTLKPENPGESIWTEEDWKDWEPVRVWSWGCQGSWLPEELR